MVGLFEGAPDIAVKSPNLIASNAYLYLSETQLLIELF